MLRNVILVVISAMVAFLFGPYDFETIYAKSVSLLLSVGKPKEATQLFREKDLLLYDGESGSKGLYLSILGQVFDVSKGNKHYGPDGGYHFFAGKDASRAFVTGDFTAAGMTDDVSDLTPTQVVALFDWLAFYQRDYEPVGKLIGRYYGEDGQPMAALRQVEAALAEGLKLKAEAQTQSKRFPSCNSEWSAASGGRVWCTTTSGGVHRDWVGVPRKLFSPGSSGFRCVCVKTSDPTELDSPNLQAYEGCPSLAPSCMIKSF